MSLVRNYLEQHGAVAFDEGDEKGRTPLMIACLYGSKDVVEYLLELGANVNTECTQLRNTPLHYTCLYNFRDYFNENRDILYIRNFHPDKGAVFLPDKVAIAKLLLNHGAVYKANSLDLTPICYAGLHQMKELVDLFGELELKEGTVSKEKIKGLEFLGVSCAIWKVLWDNSPLAYPCMLEARELHPGRVVECRNDRSSEVRDLFKRNECCSVEELKAIKEDKEEIQIEGFIMGARIIPVELKPQYFWNALLKFACDWGDLAKTCHIISFLINVGFACTELSLGQILTALRVAIVKANSISRNLCAINNVMALCFSDLSSVWSKKDDNFPDDIPDSIVKMLTHTALSSCGDSFESFAATMIRSLKLLREVKPRSYTKQEVSFFPAVKPRFYTFSPAWLMITSLTQELLSKHELEDAAIHQIKFAFSQLLSLDDASRTGTSSDTLLHKAVLLGCYKYIHTDKVFELIMSIIRMIIRHGCPVNARNENGHTAEDVAKVTLNLIKERYLREHFKGDIGLVLEAQIAKFLDELRVPWSVLTLEELAARVVLKWQVPYRDHLPSVLHKIVAGF